MVREMDQVETEYKGAVERLWSLEDAGSAPDQVESAYRAAKDLQAAYEDIARRFYPQFDESFVKRERIDLVPGGCRAEVGYACQCSRRAIVRLGGLILCTQHYKMIEDAESGYHWPDLFDRDGRAFAGHGVLNLFPGPWWWENIT